MNIPKDVYEYLMNFADDRTILNMLSTNKKFNSPIFFENVIKRIYPSLIPFKKENESWRDFFIKMTYYIAKLEEEYVIVYTATETYNPEELYNKQPVFLGGPLVSFIQSYSGPDLMLNIMAVFQYRILSRGILNLILIDYLNTNKNLLFEEDGKKYFRAGPETQMARYLSPYLSALEASDVSKFKRNKIPYNRLQSVINLGIRPMETLEANEKLYVNHPDIKALVANIQNKLASIIKQ